MKNLSIIATGNLQLARRFVLWRIRQFYFNLSLQMRLFLSSFHTPGYVHPESFLSGFSYPGLFKFDTFSVVNFY